MQAAGEPTSPCGSVVRLHGPVAPEQCLALCRRVGELLASPAGRSITCEVSGPVDLSVVDALARVHLLVIGHRSRLRVRASGHELSELLALTGLERLQRLVIET